MQSMRAYELIRETFLRKTFIWVAHLSWLGLYVLFGLLFLPTGEEVGMFVFVWGGFFLPLVLSTGIFGDDMASGRICVLATRPIWLGQLYLYRLLGLSLQGAVHLLLAGGLLFALDALLQPGSSSGLGLWLFSSWLLFNACAALSTSLSVVVKGAYNSLVLLLGVVIGYLLLDVLAGYWLERGAADGVRALVRYAGPPVALLNRLAKGEYGKYSLGISRCDLMKTVACTVHCLLLTATYGVVGILILTRRQFSAQHE